MVALFSGLLFMNCLTEYLLSKMMLKMNVLEKRYSFYHAVCAVLRIIWMFCGAWFAAPIPLILIGLFILLFLNVVPYPKRKLLMNNFIMIIYLSYVSLLMTVIACTGLLGFDINHMVQNTMLRGLISISAFIIFNIIIIFLLYYHPELLWKEDFDKSKVVIYTRFLFLCVVYHILDAVILTMCVTNWINYLLLGSGDILIMVLMFNFLNYNYVFAKSEDMKRRFEESEVQMAQKYFEKEALKKLSELDSLTNAYNRREICSIITENMQNGHQITCVFIDIDGLKQTNDKYGHTYGDRMLKRFSDACIAILQGTGYLARIGGDEFLLVFLNKEVNTIETCIKNLQAKLIDTTVEKEKIFFSYGISYDEESVDDYINKADWQMYQDKNRKRSGPIWSEKT